MFKINIKKNHDFGLLLLRLALGITFVAHGWAKFSSMEDTVAFFGMLGMASIFAYLVAIVEVVGGVALILGLHTDIAALALAAVMVVALVYVKMIKFNAPFLTGYELDFVLLAGLLTIVFCGAGKPLLKRS
jgi:putative oxidoreductase